MKCKKCGQEVSDRVAIEHLEDRIKQLESDLMTERMRPKEIHISPPQVPWPPTRQPYWGDDRYVETTPDTSAPLPKRSYEFYC